jgi:hypothetical protein
VFLAGVRVVYASGFFYRLRLARRFADASSLRSVRPMWGGVSVGVGMCSFGVGGRGRRGGLDVSCVFDRIWPNSFVFVVSFWPFVVAEVVPGVGVAGAVVVEVDASVSELALVGPKFFAADSPNMTALAGLFGSLDVLEWSVGFVSVLVCVGDEET